MALQLRSVRSPRVAAVRRLHRRPARLAEGRFVVEGPQAVAAALEAGALTQLYAVPGRADALVQRALRCGVAVTAVSEAVLDAMADTVTPQGVLGLAPLLDAGWPGAPRLVAVLERVGEPGNAGTVIRTADAAGADAVVLTAGSVDPHNAKCVRATAGSLWHLPVLSGAELAATLARLRADGLQVLAATGGGDHELDALAETGRLAAPTAWLLGSEAAGLSEEALAAADLRVRIPLRGQAESLNLAAAAAICLFASATTHRRRPTPLQ